MSDTQTAPVPAFGGNEHTFTQVDRLAEAERRADHYRAQRDAWRERARKLDAVLRDAKPLIGVRAPSPMFLLDVSAAVDGVLAEEEPQ